MAKNLLDLLHPASGQVNVYELLPLAILATLLCVTAAVVAFKLVSLFFRKPSSHPADSLEEMLAAHGGWRSLIWRKLFPGASREKTKLIDEIRRLRMLVSASDQEKTTLHEHHNKAQKRMVEMQREIEVLQGGLNDKRSELDDENEKLESLNRHTKHLEKQLEEIVVELERIYRNSTEKPISLSTPGSESKPVTPAAPAVVAMVPLPLDPEAQHTEKLKAILLAYRQRVAERRMAKP